MVGFLKSSEQEEKDEVAFPEWSSLQCLGPATPVPTLLPLENHSASARELTRFLPDPMGPGGGPSLLTAA